MPKIITITGNAASGKSLLSCHLAAALAKKQEVLLINYSADVPMHPIWQPGQKVEQTKSLGRVLSAPSIHISLISSAVEMVKGQDNIGLLGYVRSETPLSYPDISYKKCLELLNVAAELVNGYIIVDCGSEFTDPFRPAALEMADNAFMLITPDLRGLHYYSSQKTLLTGRPSCRFHTICMLAGNAKPYSPVSDMSKAIDGGYSGVLEFAEDLEKAALQGELFQSLKYCPDSYTETLANIQAVIERE